MSNSWELLVNVNMVYADVEASSPMTSPSLSKRRKECPTCKTNQIIDDRCSICHEWVN